MAWGPRRDRLGAKCRRSLWVLLSICGLSVPAGLAGAQETASAGLLEKADAAEEAAGSRPKRKSRSGRSKAESEGASLKGQPAPKTGARKRRAASGNPRAQRAEKAERRRGKGKKRGAPRGVAENYQALVAQWHAPPPEQVRTDSEATLVPALVFQVVGESTPFVLIPKGEQGGFGPEQFQVARAAFRSGEDGPEVSERLLGLIYRATRYFDVPYVHLISGVRKGRGGSRHTHGLAADIVLPGVDDEELAGFFRAQGFVGVGVYTRSGFVHVDVREKSFFWIDPSPPGKRLAIRPVRADEAKAADQAALERGKEPLVNPPRLSRALEKRASVRRKRARAKAAAAARVAEGTKAAP